MRRLIKVVSGSTFLAIAALLVPGTAFAAQNHAMAHPAKWNPIKATVHSDGTWTPERRDEPRHKTDTSNGDVVLDLRDNVDGGLCVQLRDSRKNTPLGSQRCWAAGHYGPQTLATRVLPGTTFMVDAKKGSSGSNNEWGGQIFY